MKENLYFLHRLPFLVYHSNQIHNTFNINSDIVLLFVPSENTLDPCLQICNSKKAAKFTIYFCKHKKLITIVQKKENKEVVRRQMNKIYCA